MFTEANEVEDMANVMIDNLPEFEHLQDKPLSYTFSDKAVMLGGESLMGKVVKAPTTWKADGLSDFKILIAGQSWNGLDLHQRQALIHHLLMQCSYRQERKRNGDMITVAHIRRADLVEFNATRKRFGDWTTAHESYADVERESLQEVVDAHDLEEAQAGLNTTADEDKDQEEDSSSVVDTSDQTVVS